MMYVNRTANTAVFISPLLYVMLSLHCLYWEHRNEMMIFAAAIVSIARVSYIVYTRSFMPKQFNSLQGSCYTVLFLAAHVRLYGFVSSTLAAVKKS